MGGVDKVFALLGGRPILARVVDTFQDCAVIDRIVIVLSEANLERGKQLVSQSGWTKVTAVSPGGKRRQDSIAEGLTQLGDCAWVVIHDGARPLVTASLIRRGLEAATETGAAAAAVAVTDTIKVAGEDRLVRETPAREQLWAVQTPQVFRGDLIREAYRRADNDVTDDASLVERIGHRVKLYAGTYDNIKITTPDDLALAEVLWRKYGK